MLSVVMLSVVTLNVVMLSVVMLSVDMLNVIMLSVVAPLRAIPGTLTDWGRLSTVDFVIKVVRFMKLVNNIFNI